MFRIILVGKLQAVKSIFWTLLINCCIFFVVNTYFTLETKALTVQAAQGPLSIEEFGNRLYQYRKTNNTKLLPLKLKYRLLAGRYYVPEVEPHLEEIDRALSKKGLDFSPKFVKGMFYVGQQESHWTTWRVASNEIADGHPTGIFQFLPGTFRSVHDGDILNAEHQVEAFITMVERGRVDEFAVMFTCNYEPCMDKEVFDYLMNYTVN